MDHSLIRSQAVCPLCGKGKEVGLITCWPCFRKAKYAPPGMEAKLDKFERELHLKRWPEDRKEGE